MPDSYEYVDRPSFVHGRFDPDWEFVENIRGGTRRLRELASVSLGAVSDNIYLPQFPRESTEQYTLRVRQSYVRNFYDDAIQTYTSGPFARPITVNESKLPEALMPMLGDIDGTGTSLDDWGMDGFDRVIDYGVIHALVDFPVIERNIEAAQTGQPGDRRSEQGMLPTIVLVSPRDLIASEPDATAENGIGMVRIRETRVEGDTLQRYVREYTRKDWSLFQYVKDAWVRVGGAPHTFGEVPLVTEYSYREGPLVGSPPLLDLAWATLDYAQSYSDQRNILHVARVPMPVQAGMTVEDEMTPDQKKNIVVTTSRYVKSKDTNFKLYYFEPQGTGLAHGELHLADVKAYARELMSEPLTVRGPSTATGEMRAESKAQNKLSAWVEAHEIFMWRCFQYAGRWLKVEVPEKPFGLFRDYDIGFRGPEEVNGAREDWKLGAISTPTYLKILKRHGRLPQDLDEDAEMEAVAAEGRGPSAGMTEPTPEDVPVA